MNILSRLLIAVVFFVVCCPLQILADDCAPVKTEASRLFKKAQAEYKLENFEEAMDLYERAKRYYRRLAELECEPNASEFGKKSMEGCEKNISLCEENIVKQKKMKEKTEAVEQFNLATKRFNEGIDFTKKRQWAEAVEAFEEASEIWGRVAAGETDMAEKAKPRVEKAEELAKQAQKRSGSESNY